MCCSETFREFYSDEDHIYLIKTRQEAIAKNLITRLSKTIYIYTNYHGRIILFFSKGNAVTTIHPEYWLVMVLCKAAMIDSPISMQFAFTQVEMMRFTICK